MNAPWLHYVFCLHTHNSCWWILEDLQNMGMGKKFMISKFLLNTTQPNINPSLYWPTQATIVWSKAKALIVSLFTMQLISSRSMVHSKSQPPSIYPPAERCSYHTLGLNWHHKSYLTPVSELTVTIPCIINCLCTMCTLMKRTIASAYMLAIAIGWQI